MQMSREAQIKSDSYRIRDTIPPGSHASITDRVERYGEVALVPGDVVYVVSYSNAGFRGIEATVKDMYGRTWHGISAGILAEDD